MAKQRYVNTKYWRDSYIEDLDPTEKLLFLYLLTNPDTNISGIYEIPLKIIAVDTGIDKEMVRKILTRFENDDKIKYLSGWVAIKNFTNHQTISPKIKIGIETELKSAPKEMVLWVNINPKIEYTRPIQELSDLNSNTNTNLNSNTNIIKQPKPKKAPVVLPPIPDNLLKLDNFKQTWDKWIVFKKEIKNPVTKTSATMQYNMLSKQHDPVMVIEQSIMNGWKGFWPVNGKNITPPQKPLNQVTDEDREQHKF